MFNSESGLTSCKSSGRREQKPDSMNQCECKVFDLLNDEYSIPSRRIVIRSLVYPQHFISSCEHAKVLDAVTNSNAMGIILSPGRDAS